MKKNLTIQIISFLVLVLVPASIFISQRDDIAPSDSEASDNGLSYPKMNRFGIGRLTEMFPKPELSSEYEKYKVGWFHNWGSDKDFFGEAIPFPGVIPNNLDFVGLVGGYNSNSTDCSQSLKTS